MTYILYYPMYGKEMIWFMAKVGLTIQSDISLLSRRNKRNAIKPRPFKRFANTNRNTNCYMKKRKLESRRTEPKKKGSTFPRVTLFSLLLSPSDTVTRKCIATGIHRRFSPTVCLREVDRGISGSITENLVTPNV